jgi:hypothetical protein
MDERLTGLAGLAKKQFGLISVHDVLAQKFSRRQLKRFVEQGKLVRSGIRVFTFPGVPDQSWDHLAMRATLLCGPGSALSHQTAGFLHGLDGLELGRDAPKILDVTTINRMRVALDGLRVHPSRLEKLHATTIRGLPVTSLPSTMLDLADVLPRLELEKALDSARRIHRNFEAWFEQFIEGRKNHGRHGVRTIRQLLHERSSALDSALEVELRAIITAAQLPQPLWGYTVYGDGQRIMKVDAAWLTPNLNVALHGDGFGTHGQRAQFEKDAVQRTRLAEFGWHNVIVTWRGRHETYWTRAVRRLLGLA